MAKILFVNPSAQNDFFSNVPSLRLPPLNLAMLAGLTPEKYEMEIIVNTSKPNLEFTKSLKFNLSEEDIKQLRLNAIGIIRYLCGFNVQWFFAFPKYLEI